MNEALAQRHQQALQAPCSLLQSPGQVRWLIDKSLKAKGWMNPDAPSTGFWSRILSVLLAVTVSNQNGKSACTPRCSRIPMTVRRWWGVFSTQDSRAPRNSPVLDLCLRMCDECVIMRLPPFLYHGTLIKKKKTTNNLLLRPYWDADGPIPSLLFTPGGVAGLDEASQLEVQEIPRPSG